MRDLIISIFGAYTPITYEHETLVWDSATETFQHIYEDIIPSGTAGVDWTYVLGVIAFLVVLYSILRIIGSVISRV